MGYCNRKASVLMNKVSVTLDEAERAKLWWKAEAMMANDIPSVPVYARPVFVIRRNSVKGPVVNPTSEGSPWNVAGWTA
jgi:peptide/nickel transport system substrate-binding protein